MSSSLSAERVRFGKMKSMLYHYMDFLGLLYAPDQGKRCTDCPNTHPRSTHKVGLAEDIILYGPGFVYPHPSAEALYNQLHDLWDLLGGAPRIIGDLNHFSVEWEGVK